MLRSTLITHRSMRSRKKYPYLVSYGKLPWNVVEAGSENCHKILAPCFVKVFETAIQLQQQQRQQRNISSNNNKRSGSSSNSSNATTRFLQQLLLQETHPTIPEDQWLFRLPSTSYIIQQNIQKQKFQQERGEGEQEGDGEEENLLLSPFGWEGRPIEDSMCLSHYGPIHAHIGPVKQVVEFRSPDLRIICNSIKIGNFYKNNNDNDNNSSSTCYSLYHFYRPNRAPTELLAAFDKYETVSNRQAPDLSALKVCSQDPQWKSNLLRASTPKGEVASPMPKLTTPTSPMYGLAEREALKPGDTFGSRSRMWGHHW